MIAGDSPLPRADSRGPSDVTRLLTAWRAGDVAAFDPLDDTRVAT
jgi:hypothetical protein